MAWYCMHDNTPSDPKWIVIAKRSGQPKVAVLALWMALLDYANQQPKRGSLDGIDCEVLDALLDLDEGASNAIMQAMTDKGLIADGRIANWDKRQLATKTDGNSKSATERSREYRQRKRNEMQRDATQGNANATQGNGMQRDATDIKRNNIKENNINPPYPPGGNAAGEDFEPSIEFTELRAIWNEQVIAEAEQVGARAYRYLKRTKQWPGLGVIRDDILKRKASSYWKPTFEPGLERYLSDRGWTAPLENPRAARAQVDTFEQSGGYRSDDPAQRTWKNYQEIKARLEQGEAI